MDEYIKKESAIAKCREIVACEWNHIASPVSWADAYEQFAEDIKGIQTADVAPVRHGRWEWCKDYDGDSILVCSECGRVCHEEDAPYCYCGCKMDLEG